MEAKEMKEKFVSLYNMMATSNNVKYMHTFGDTTRKMFDWLVVNKPDIASEFLSQLESIKWKNYLTKAEADSIIRKAEEKAKVMVSEEVITKQAQQRAYDILTAAQTKSKEIRNATNDYVESMLSRVDELLASNLTDVRKTRSALKGTKN